ncbi:MAG: TIGR03905 family TSCPD domain-containing protein [Oscillospiraceae bacterium]|nr:TIGR03905 family TSCPD domain-containing protein [Oscillospiraceae bacterium]
MKYTYKTQDVCSSEIQFELDGDTVRHISFVGGCNGNLKAIAKLCEGMKASTLEQTLSGNTCGSKATSCADQLARAVREAREGRHSD